MNTYVRHLLTVTTLMVLRSICQQVALRSETTAVIIRHTLLINEAQACGINWIRVDVNWYDIEPTKGNFSWSRYDAIVAAAEARGIIRLL